MGTDVAELRRCGRARASSSTPSSEFSSASAAVALCLCNLRSVGESWLPVSSPSSIRAWWRSAEARRRVHQFPVRQ